MCLVNNNNNGSMAEWSNASDSRSDSFGSAGSNPAGDTFYKKPHSNHLLFLESTIPNGFC